MAFTNFKNQSTKSLPDKHNKVQLSHAPQKVVFRSSIPKNRKLKKRLLFYRYMNSFGACGVYNGKENTKENTVPKKSTKIHEKYKKKSLIALVSHRFMMGNKKSLTSLVALILKLSCVVFKCRSASVQRKHPQCLRQLKYGDETKTKPLGRDQNLLPWHK